MILVKDQLAFLGLEVQDKVTTFSGIVTSVSFDLYGCIQCLVNPGLDNDGKIKDSVWFDSNRLNKMTKNPVIPLPEFDYLHGPEVKPTNRKP